MFERFTDRARGVIVGAEQEARSLAHPHLGTEHLLLAIVQDGGCVGGHAFASLGVSYDQVRDRVTSFVRCDVEGRSERVAFTARAKQLLARSMREAVKQAHTQIGTGDLTLALLAMSDGTAARVLDDLGVDRMVARTRVLETAAQISESQSPPVRRVPTAPQLSPQAQELLLRALRVGSSYVARRYMPPSLMRGATTTARVTRALGSQLGSAAKDGPGLASPVGSPAIPEAEHEPRSLPPMTPLVPAACVVCGTKSPDCGTLYVGARGALVCERCSGGAIPRDR